VKLHDLPDSILYCLRGALRHEWEEYQPVQRRTQWGQPVSYRCGRCGMTKYLVIDSLGNISHGPHYEKPAGYPDIDAYTTGDVRLEVIRRAKARARSRSGFTVVNGGRR
jgi:hypothetical protein